jgi:hypothetical protein
LLFVIRVLYSYYRQKSIGFVTKFRQEKKFSKMFGGFFVELESGLSEIPMSGGFIHNSHHQLKVYCLYTVAQLEPILQPILEHLCLAYLLAHRNLLSTCHRGPILKLSSFLQNIPKRHCLRGY